MFKPLTNLNHSITKLTQGANPLWQKHAIVSQMKNCSRLSELESVYATMIKSGANQDCFFINQFITACSTFCRLDYAILAFTQMENPNVFVYNAMIRGFIQSSSPYRALELLLVMLRGCVSPSSFTFSPVIKACTLASALGFGKAVQAQIWKYGFNTHVCIQTALVDFYSNMKNMFDARKAFDEMPEKDVFAWTAMASAHVHAGDLSSARRLFDEMPGRNTASWNTMIDGCAKLGNLESAEELFNQMPTKDIISWTTMIQCYSQNKKFGEAISTFNEMKNTGIRPDEVIMTTVISACAHLGALELGKGIHLCLMQNRSHLDVFLGSALIDMYAKCGSLERALVVFFKLQKKNLFCWNAVIEGLATHGFAEEALAVFSRMVRENIRPNGVTFVSVLSACTHAGLVEEGRRSFLSMTSDFSISPGIKHYGCMVDLLAKAGLLEDALELIRTMEIEPNSVIWGALLSGCKLHNNLEIAKAAVNQLVVLEPSNTGYYTLLVSMYAEAHWWSEVAKIRTIMKELGVEKTCPGSSWVELDRNIHQFSASDEYHQAYEEIQLLLAELDGQLKLACYVPDLGVYSP